MKLPMLKYECATNLPTYNYYYYKGYYEKCSYINTDPEIIPMLDLIILYSDWIKQV